MHIQTEWNEIQLELKWKNKHVHIIHIVTNKGNLYKLASFHAKKNNLTQYDVS